MRLIAFFEFSHDVLVESVCIVLVARAQSASMETLRADHARGWPLLLVAFLGLLEEVATHAVSLLFDRIEGAIKGVTGSVEISGHEGGDDVDI